ncbi:hypothetical protein AB0M28_13445 [Streptomyces sp. NPDC051940]|uniref:hypothetical protein n=1 Tax=Streptomyces sp. NPDC051940 TaxID=3155675 RepID=UPI0034495029
MPLNSSSLTLRVQADQTSLLDLATGQIKLDWGQSPLALGSGVAANQADRLFTDRRTLAASASEDLDLAAVLLDAFGATLTFARIKGLIVKADSANINNVIVGGAAANGFVSWAGGATHTVTVRPGGVLALWAPDAVAYAVTAGTADLLKVANGGAGSGVTYDIILIGASA